MVWVIVVGGNNAEDEVWRGVGESGRFAIPHPLQRAQRIGHPGLGGASEEQARATADSLREWKKKGKCNDKGIDVSDIHRFT